MWYALIDLECSWFIIEYMIKKLGIEESKAPELCVSLYKYYGTTMAGLRVITQELDALFYFTRFF